MIYLNKILPVFVMPIMLIIYLMIYGVWKKKRWPIYTAIISLYIFSTPIFAENFFKLIEGTAPRQTPQNVTNAEAIVVLSGMINQVKSTNGVYPEWMDPDRFFAGIDLYKSGNAPKIIFTRGKMPWDKSKNTEGDILRQFALEYGVPDSAIVLTGNVENTADEAKAVGKLMGKWKHIILVTSAYHMPRAKQNFETQDFIVQPFKVDFKVDQLNGLTLMDFLPDAESFRLLNIGYRELIGRVIYYIF
ncbi:YdcF family protein [Sediminibacterium sp.]|uniref:YdcF family protein n=1 Tax=Sediminibacterium sp. TaxID=1917865 RepID=UPI0027368350|nr:YdcF family protein [Sediminibacterium sp.]MDP3392154.1 YdcF family protein [Sediminibacterium sp.]MDP3567044.1 YdcF family protein [Sediminibacterium sp.]